MTTTTIPNDILDLNGELVIDFNMRLTNDRNRVRASMKEQVAAMLMDNIRKLWASGAWRHYRTALGEFEWLEHEFDYFLAANLIRPREVADIVRGGDFDAWSELVNATNPGKGQRGATRRLVGDVVSQIGKGVPGGHGDADVWVRHAAAGFGDHHDQQIAKSPTKLRAVKKAGSLSAVKRKPTVRINLHITRDESESLDQQRSDAILRYLAANPGVAALVKKAL